MQNIIENNTSHFLLKFIYLAQAISGYQQNEMEGWSVWHSLSNLQTLSKHKCALGVGLKIKIISLFSLFLLLFIGLIALFGTIYRLYCTIWINFYFYLQYFQQ